MMLDDAAASAARRGSARARFAILAVGILLAACAGDNGHPARTATITAAPSPTRTSAVATSTATATTTPTQSATPSAPPLSPTSTPTSTSTPTISATATSTESPTPNGRLAVLGAPGRALTAAGGRLFAATTSHVWVSDDEGHTWRVTRGDGLPRGNVTALTALATQPPVLLAHVWGKGLFRSEDLADTWQPVEPPLTAPVLQALNPRGQVVPFDIAADPSDASHVIIAAPGGLFRSRDAGRTWTALNPSSPGKLNIALLGAAARGMRLFAVSQNPVSIIPPAYANLLEGGVFSSDDDGATWRSATNNLAAAALTDVAIDTTGTVYVTAMDGGLFRREDDGTWTSLGGPEDAVAVSPLGDAVVVGSASRGIWRLEDSTWTQAGAGPTAGLAGEVGLMHDGALYALGGNSDAPPPAPAGGTVHVALSFHTNLYHSFRGDRNDDTGFGKDIRVIRNTLNWLERFPDVHADWDIENAFSLDDLLPRFAPDLVARIRERVTSGQDGLRIMSWNNGAVASETREEFAASIDGAKQSYQDVFGSFDPGVQPQENMFSPDHVAWYREHGIEWITLFNSATPFTAFPGDLTLNGAALYNPVTLRDGDDSMVLVPVYHHADMLDHGGLRAWVRQIAATIPGDTLLVIHMDADADFWLKFDLELEALRDEPAVRYTTIQDYLDGHSPSETVSLPGDLADGVGDGFASWAEKLFNHEIATVIAAAREETAWARFLAGDDQTVAALADAALRPRVRALSTTHFGLASPFIVADRVATARARTAEALAAAGTALEAAQTLAAVAPGTIEVVNARDATGTALVEIPLQVPAAQYAGTAALTLRAGDGAVLPAAIDVTDDSRDPVRLTATTVLALQARETRVLSWTYDATAPSRTRPSGDLDLPTLPLGIPFSECGGVRADGRLLHEDDAPDETAGIRHFAHEEYALPFCDGSGTVSQTRIRYAGLPGTVVDVGALMGVASDPLRAESVVLSPLLCAGDLASITWRTFGGATRTRPARKGQETWNGQSADGWTAFHCEDGRTIAVAHRVIERTSLAFAPLRNDQGQAVIAPLGTLWGDAPWHDARRIGGLGIGDVVTGLVGSQFRPAAPDWSGQTVRYRLLLLDDANASAPLDEGTLDLFAHPPLVRVGPSAG